MTLHTDCVITYQKSNNNIIMRPSINDRNLKIGDTTSMGWKVLDIHYRFVDGNYYHEIEYRHKWHELKRKHEPIKVKIAYYLTKSTYYNKREPIKTRIAHYLMK